MTSAGFLHHGTLKTVLELILNTGRFYEYNVINITGIKFRCATILKLNLYTEPSIHNTTID